MSDNSHVHGQVPMAHAHPEEITAAQSVERITVQPKGTDTTPVPSSQGSTGHNHGRPELTEGGIEAGLPALATKNRFAFLRTKQFWIVLALSQILALAITGTNTFTTLLRDEGVNFPAFQTIFNYALLNIVYTSFTIYKLGFKAWFRLLLTDGWKFFILAFCDVEGNYFTIYAYQYTNLLSAQLLSFWAIFTVVVISFILLKVRYHILQVIGILICCGGLGILVASDRITGGAQDASDMVKGDLFALLGATFYGLANVFEEFLVSKKPLWLVVGQLAFWATIIDGVQIAIFERGNVESAVWSPAVGGYLVGFTLILALFYSFAPIVFRMSSAAFFNIGLLTANFWGLIIGTRVFNYPVHWMYPLAFVLIIGGHFVYYGTEGVLGEARKPWLGKDQAGGVSGIGTAKRRLERPHVLV